MSDTSNVIHKLNDSVIGHIAKLLQLSMLTGTDIVDHIRMIRLVEQNETLVLEHDYSKVFDLSLDKMLENSKEQMN